MTWLPSPVSPPTNVEYVLRTYLPALGFFRRFDSPIQIGEHGYGSVSLVQTQSYGTAISSVTVSGPGDGFRRRRPLRGLDSTPNPAWVWN